MESQADILTAVVGVFVGAIVGPLVIEAVGAGVALVGADVLTVGAGVAIVGAVVAAVGAKVAAVGAKVATVGADVTGLAVGPEYRLDAQVSGMPNGYWLPFSSQQFKRSNSKGQGTSSYVTGGLFQDKDLKFSHPLLRIGSEKASQLHCWFGQNSQAPNSGAEQTFD